MFLLCICAGGAVLPKCTRSVCQSMHEQSPPGFVQTHPQDLLSEHITARDAAVLQYLEGVRVKRTRRPHVTQSYELVFRPNPCLTDRVLLHSIRVESGE